MADYDSTSIRQLLANRKSLPPPERRRAIREGAGISLRQMGDALDVTGSCIKKWEEGAAEPRPRNLHEYVQLLKDLEEA